MTDDVLDRLAKEAEAGLEITTLRRRPGRPAMGSGTADSFPVRLDPDATALLDHLGAPAGGGASR